MILDTPDCTTRQIAHLQADEVTDVLRYLTTSIGSSKLVTPAEAHALGAASIRLGLVFEVYGGADGVNDIDATDGLLDAEFCLKYVPTLGAPTDGSVCIYFACDTDFTASHIQSMVLPYFEALSSKLAGSGYMVGVYGSGFVCRSVCAAGYAVRSWLSGSMGWTGSKEYLAAMPKELALVQQTMDIKIANLDADVDRAVGPSIGTFLPTVGATS